jgi:hypothetical protein
VDSAILKPWLKPAWYPRGKVIINSPAWCTVCQRHPPHGCSNGEGQKKGGLGGWGLGSGAAGTHLDKGHTVGFEVVW